MILFKLNCNTIARANIVVRLPADFFKITDGLIIFSADIQISRIYADSRKFG